ncbi:hypothetical protein B566_EDAN007732 [Ephemera danica]|nr:hypothetical protein B566_EDAN007732 [Ephemera danica]
MAAFKVIVIFAVLVAAVAAQHGHHDEYAVPKYEYKYGVNDGHTKDVKEASEHRVGHHTDSEYKVLEADHHNTRTVKLTIDSQPLVHHHQPQHH